MTTITASIVADSVSPDGVRLTSIHMRYPRFIHAELMTHRVFSRNARSSRAVPVETMLREIESDPVVPLHWGANQKGMQADQECAERVYLLENYLKDDGEIGSRLVGHSREDAWLQARSAAITVARAFMKAGYHKQVVNRLLEPFMHIDVLVSATEWANFLALRDHHMAEPHIAILAREVRAAMDGSTPERLVVPEAEWHLPYIDVETWEQLYRTGMSTEDVVKTAIKVSVARCARISYKPFDGNGSIEAEIKRHDDLVGAVPMHASPAEHQATPDFQSSYLDGTPRVEWAHPSQHGNFRGWRQYRKMLAGENQA